MGKHNFYIVYFILRNEVKGHPLFLTINEHLGLHYSLSSVNYTK